jgi:hypothetical protein
LVTLAIISRYGRPYEGIIIGVNGGLYLATVIG